MRIIIISGLSGSGKSTAVRALEDEGFFCLDNLPVMLVPTFIELVGNSKDPVREAGTFSRDMNGLSRRSGRRVTRSRYCFSTQPMMC